MKMCTLFVTLRYTKMKQGKEWKNAGHTTGI